MTRRVTALEYVVPHLADDEALLLDVAADRGADADAYRLLAHCALTGYHSEQQRVKRLLEMNQRLRDELRRYTANQVGAA